jgi:ketosteroid isomerase-like protein
MGRVMHRDEARRYAEEWAEAWNRRDLEAVLAHFEDDVVFSSPKALQIVGVPTLRGKPPLRDYWRAALASVGSLRFTVRRILWDGAAAELSIVYDRDLDGRRDRAAEVLQFGPAGRVVRGEVFYGVVPG